MSEHAQLAYEAYNDQLARDIIAEQGGSVEFPQWDTLGERARGAWRAATAQAVIDAGFRHGMSDDAAMNWAQVSGYVSEMVRGGSTDAVDILRLMHELSPSTALFTGTVEELLHDGQEDG